MLIVVIHLAIILGIAYGASYYVASRQIRRMIGPGFAGGYLILALSGFYVPTAPIFFLCCILVFVATVRDRLDAICRYFLFNLLLPGIDWRVLVHGAYLGTYSTDSALMIGAIIAFLVKPDRTRAKPVRGFSAEDMLVIVSMLIFWVGATRFPGATEVGRSLLMQAVTLIAPYLLFRRQVRTPEEWQLLLGCIAIGGVMLAICAVAEARLGWPLFDIPRLKLSGGMPHLDARGGTLRATVSMSGPLVLAIALMIGLIAAVCARSAFNSKLNWRGSMGVIFLGLLSCQSRGTTAALVPALVVLFITTRRFANAVILVIVAVVGGTALYVLQNFSTKVAGFMGASQHVGQYYDYRQLLLDRGLQEGMKHPWLGQSMDKVLDSLSDITQGQRIVDMVNTYLTIFMVSGIVGLVAFVALLMVVGRKMLAHARRGQDLDAIRNGRAFLLSAMTGYLINIFSESFIDRVPFMLMLMLAGNRLIAASLVKSRKGQRGRPPPPARPAGWAVAAAPPAPPAPARSLAPSA